MKSTPADDAVSDPVPSRRPEILVAPVVSTIALCLVLLVARHYDRMPVRAAECSFRSLTGIPCVGCGGTRAAQALSRGQVVEAVGFNPGVVLLFGACFAWLGWRLVRFLRKRPAAGSPASAGRLVVLFLSVGGLLLANWIYLILHLP